MMPERDRLLNLVRGSALLLVVFGHALGGDPAISSRLAALEWTLPVGSWIYSFHMPLFMACAGWAQALSSSSRGGGSGPWSGFLLRRARRLLLPFVLAAALLHGPVGAMLNPDASWAGETVRLLLGLGGGQLWFLWTLFSIQVVVKAAEHARLPAFAWAALLLACSIGSLARGSLGLPDLFEWNSVLRFLPWYVLGRFGPVLARFLGRSRARPPLAAIAGWLLHGCAWMLAGKLPDHGNALLTTLAHLAGEATALLGVLSLVATTSWLDGSNSNRISGFLLGVDRRGMEIYLIHGPVQWMLAWLFVMVGIGAAAFPFVATVAGLIAPAGLAIAYERRVRMQGG